MGKFFFVPMICQFGLFPLITPRHTRTDLAPVEGCEWEKDELEGQGLIPCKAGSNSTWSQAHVLFIPLDDTTCIKHNIYTNGRGGSKGHTMKDDRPTIYVRGQAKFILGWIISGWFFFLDRVSFMVGKV